MRGRLLFALVTNTGNWVRRSMEAVEQSGEIARTKLEYAATALLSPTAGMIKDLGEKLNAVSYIGRDCSVERNVSAFVPSMLMEELDTKVVDGEYVLRSPSEAVNAVRQEMVRKGGMEKVFSRTLHCIPKEGAYERVIDLNKKPN